MNDNACISYSRCAMTALFYKPSKQHKKILQYRTTMYHVLYGDIPCLLLGNVIFHKTKYIFLGKNDVKNHNALEKVQIQIFYFRLNLNRFKRYENHSSLSGPDRPLQLLLVIKSNFLPGKIQFFLENAW